MDYQQSLMQVISKLQVSALDELEIETEMLLFLVQRFFNFNHSIYKEWL